MQLNPFWQQVLNDKLNILRFHNSDLLDDLLKFVVVDTVEVVPAALLLELLLKRLRQRSNLSIQLTIFFTSPCSKRTLNKCASVQTLKIHAKLILLDLSCDVR